ncbi:MULTISPECIES: Crp/Fnr family transcriptional regulator [Variovorax]|uniref:Crp/Fnr family transcriptional regulator n=1 Tax=Variovorax TaxID=34072 RepID=UPI00285C27A2|nr:Crp/Fnr family transcriptional regulator [Variovorax sp. 3319]MDR6890561.1 CRP-like cAMP-binding protein [Variovorax sp. 3319]
MNGSEQATGATIFSDDLVLVERALRLTPGFAMWPSAAMQQVLAISTLGRYSRGEIIASEEGPKEILAVVSGYIVVERVQAAVHRSVVALLGPGYVLGFTRSPEDEDQASHHYCFRALNDTVVVHMPAAQVLKVLDDDPVLWRDMAKMLLKQVRQVFELLLSQGIGSFQRRIAATIERLALLYGRKVGGETGLCLRLTQEDLAALLQVTRQSVNKELAQLAACGAISVSYKVITVLDIDALKKRAMQAP